MQEIEHFTYEVDDLINAFRKKVVNVKDGKMSIDKLLEWVSNDRSLQQHRMCQAYITYLYQSYGKGTKAEFVEDIKKATGFCRIKRKPIEFKGEKYMYIRCHFESLSFGSCSQKRHQEFFENLKSYANRKYGVDFEQWERYYETGK